MYNKIVVQEQDLGQRAGQKPLKYCHENVLHVPRFEVHEVHMSEIRPLYLAKRGTSGVHDLRQRGGAKVFEVADMTYIQNY